MNAEDWLQVVGLGRTGETLIENLRPQYVLRTENARCCTADPSHGVYHIHSTRSEYFTCTPGKTVQKQCNVHEAGGV